MLSLVHADACTFQTACSPFGHATRVGTVEKLRFAPFFDSPLEDKSDRQMEEFLHDSLAAKFFCNFGLCDETPDYSYFSKFRSRIGTYQLSKIFKKMVASLKKEGLIREFYTFVDASKIVAYVDSWKVRDKAIADAQNNEVVVEAIPIS